MNHSPDSQAETSDGKSSGGVSDSYTLIGFCLVLLVLSAFVLNSPDLVSRWGKRYFGWKTPQDQCIFNLKQIDSAVRGWALENKMVATDTYSLTNPTVFQYLKGSVLPRCPQGGSYVAGTNVADIPHCTISGHTM